MGERNWNVSEIPEEKRQEIHAQLRADYDDLWDEEAATWPVVLTDGVLRWKEDPVFAGLIKLNHKLIEKGGPGILDLNALCVAGHLFRGGEELRRKIYKRIGYSLEGYADCFAQQEDTLSYSACVK